MSRARILTLTLLGLATGCAPDSYSRGAVSVALAHPTDQYPVTWSGEGSAKAHASAGHADPSGSRGDKAAARPMTTYGGILAIEHYSGGLPPTIGTAPAPTGPGDSGSKNPIDQAALEKELEQRNVERHKAFDAEARAARTEMDATLARARKEENDAQERSVDELRRADERDARSGVAQGRRKLGATLTILGAAVAVGGGVLIGLTAGTNASIQAGGYSTGSDISGAETRGQVLNVAGFACLIAGGVSTLIGIPIWITHRPSVDVGSNPREQAPSLSTMPAGFRF